MTGVGTNIKYLRSLGAYSFLLRQLPYAQLDARVLRLLVATLLLRKHEDVIKGEIEAQRRCT